MCSYTFHFNIIYFPRLLTIDERVPLRAIESDAWPSQFSKYLDRLQCPLSPPPSTPPVSIISWLLGAAVRLEFGEKPERFNKKQKEAENLDGKKAGYGFSGPEFEAGVAALAEILKVFVSTLHNENLAQFLFWQFRNFHPGAMAS